MFNTAFNPIRIHFWSSGRVGNLRAYARLESNGTSTLFSVDQGCRAGLPFGMVEVTVAKLQIPAAVVTSGPLGVDGWAGWQPLRPMSLAWKPGHKHA